MLPLSLCDAKNPRLAPLSFQVLTRAGFVPGAAFFGRQGGIRSLPPAAQEGLVAREGGLVLRRGR